MFLLVYLGVQRKSKSTCKDHKTSNPFGQFLLLLLSDVKMKDLADGWLCTAQEQLLLMAKSADGDEGSGETIEA